MQGQFNNKAKKQNKKISIGIALQGGGSYGAYTMGVLKALLQSDFTKQAEIKAVTGTSAGAINGALLAYGLNKSGPDEAVQRLDSLWSGIKTAGSAISFWNGLGPTLNPSWPNIPQYKTLLFSFAQAAMPAGLALQQLKDTLNAEIADYDILRNGPTQLFVNAVKEDKNTKQRTHVVFTGAELSDQTIVSSGALEDLGGLNIDGDKYYDGAYWRNPCFSDIKKENISDLLVITLQGKPNRAASPRHQDDARNQDHQKAGHELITNEIHDHIEYIQQNHANLNLHVISLDVDPRWNDSSRMNTDPAWLKKLEDMGRDDANQWLKTGLGGLGLRSSHKKTAPKGGSGNSNYFTP